MSKLVSVIGVLVCAAFMMGAEGGCDDARPVSASGVSKANVQIPVGTDGLTIEQRNVRDRLIEDNKPGAIKHLYIISAYSGQTIIYSTVKGKVSSSGKRLTPSRVQYSKDTTPNGFAVDIGGHTHYTDEVLGDDGTYGPSVEYLYWIDSRGIYHQHYPSGGQIIHVSNEPVAVKSVVINMESDIKNSGSK